MQRSVAYLGLTLAFLLLGAGYAAVVPAGEAPDEPAHLAYIDHLVRFRSLPPKPAPPYGLSYEAHQPPLDYAVSAACLAALGGGPLDYAFVPNPSFSFAARGSRAFRGPGAGAAPAGTAMVRGLRRLRSIRLPWGVLTMLCTLETALLVAGGRPGLAIAAASPWVFAPQFLFVSATINNDAAVTAFSAAAVLGLVHLVVAGEGARSSWAWGAGLAAGLAIWCKASGFMLTLPLLGVAAVLVRRREKELAGLLVGPFLLLAAGWFALALARFGALWPPPPTGFLAEPATRLARAALGPWWLASLWVSFWGKFGWLNLRLPSALYLWFLVPTLCVARGLATLRRPAAGRAAVGLLLAVVASNCGLVLAYLVRIDWQPQGRYLFPSLAALAGLAAAGMRSAAESDRPEAGAERWLAVLAVGISVATAAFGIATISRAYG